MKPFPVQLVPVSFMTVTIRDVARKAGVGVATVSRVLNQSPLVSESKRQVVEKVIAELSYVPNPTARRLSLGRTNTIGVIVPFFTRPSMVERLRGISEVFEGSAYDLVVYNVESLRRREQYLNEVPRSDRVDAVLIVSMSPGADDIVSLKRFGLPIVLLDGENPQFNTLIEDSVAGGYMATMHLIELGHRRIAFVGGAMHDPFNFAHTPNAKRLQGYRQALHEAGIPYRDDYYVHIDKTLVTGRLSTNEAREWLLESWKQPDRPTAVFAASDTHAFGVLQGAREMHIRVPEDLSIVGYDDIEAASYVELTTVRQFLYETGKRGAERLLALLENPNDAMTTEQLPLELVVRNTTAPALDRAPK